VGGGAAEAVDLGGLGGEVHEGVEDQVDEGERAVEAGGGEVTDGHGNVGAAGLGPQAGDHGAGHVDAVHGHAAAGEGQGDPPGADGQLEGGAVAGELGQQVDGGVDGGGLEHLVLGVVVGGGDALPEVTVRILHAREGTSVSGGAVHRFSP
jgi:hypothetical protein